MVEHIPDFRASPCASHRYHESLIGGAEPFVGVHDRRARDRISDAAGVEFEDGTRSLAEYPKRILQAAPGSTITP